MKDFETSPLSISMFPFSKKMEGVLTRLKAPFILQGAYLEKNVLHRWYMHLGMSQNEVPFMIQKLP